MLLVSANGALAVLLTRIVGAGLPCRKIVGDILCYCLIALRALPDIISVRSLGGLDGLNKFIMVKLGALNGGLRILAAVPLALSYLLTVIGAGMLSYDCPLAHIVTECLAALCGICISALGAGVDDLTGLGTGGFDGRGLIAV